MNRVQRLQALFECRLWISHEQLRALSGMSAKDLARAVDLATAPRGPLRRVREAGQWLYRLATEHERTSQPRGKRGVKPGSPWSPARRRAQEKRSAMRGLCAGPAGSAVLPQIRSGMPGVWGAVSLAPAALAGHEGRAGAAAAARAQDLGGPWAPGGAAARAGQAGLETVGAPCA